MVFYLKNKRVSRKEIVNKIGELKLLERIEEARFIHCLNPYEHIKWKDGMEIEL